MITSVNLAKRAMRLIERVPTENDLALAQIFNTDGFLKSSPADQRALMRASSQFRVDHETKLPFERHFRRPIRPYLEGKTVLDLGCFTGGRTVAWHKKYRIKKSYGIDVEQRFIDAAQQFADDEEVDSTFSVGFGEAIPLADESCDAIISYDVFEHVRDVRATMAEAYRVLKPGGVIITCFPPFYTPTEHHLSGVSMTPALHWFFDKNALFQAYREIIQQRAGASWYLPDNEKLADWESLYTLNGITIRRFTNIVRRQHWQTEEFSLPFWLTSVRRIHNSAALRKIFSALRIVNYVPVTRELTTDRICAILKKPVSKRPEAANDA